MDSALLNPVQQTWSWQATLESEQFSRWGRNQAVVDAYPEVGMKVARKQDNMDKHKHGLCPTLGLVKNMATLPPPKLQSRTADLMQKIKDKKEGKTQHLDMRNTLAKEILTTWDREKKRDSRKNRRPSTGGPVKSSQVEAIPLDQADYRRSSRRSNSVQSFRAQSALPARSKSPTETPTRGRSQRPSIPRPRSVAADAQTNDKVEGRQHGGELVEDAKSPGFPKENLWKSASVESINAAAKDLPGSEVDLIGTYHRSPLLFVPTLTEPKEVSLDIVKMDMDSIPFDPYRYRLDRPETDWEKEEEKDTWEKEENGNRRHDPVRPGTVPNLLETANDSKDYGTRPPTLLRHPIRQSDSFENSRRRNWLKEHKRQKLIEQTARDLAEFIDKSTDIRTGEFPTVQIKPKKGSKEKVMPPPKMTDSQERTWNYKYSKKLHDMNKSSSQGNQFQAGKGGLIDERWVNKIGSPQPAKDTLLETLENTLHPNMTKSYASLSMFTPKERPQTPDSFVDQYMVDDDFVASSYSHDFNIRKGVLDFEHLESKHRKRATDVIDPNLFTNQKNLLRPKYQLHTLPGQKKWK